MPDIGNWSINRLLSTSARMLEHSWNNHLRELGLTHAGVTALGVIAREGKTSQVRIASIVGVQAQTMGKTLSRLESHHYVFRVRNANDRRSYLLDITDAGRDVLARAEKIDKNLASLGALANPEFREMLVDIVRKLSEEEGNDIVLHGAHEEHRAAVGLADFTGDIEPVQPEGEAPIEVSQVVGPTTAVLDIVTPELLDAARAQREQ
ncbi:MarR family winged helix-turn-helix transcriptional regulator [Rothia sp. CCM 9419]|uniref:MarR family winged helix-turn-helix transcriptional regulator n=1 Tax=Rothia sp. CCM 9419 TaxID=3402662 RepID=UPI003AEA3043